ncbi:MAG: complex I NDUFA9 subunit family protein [Candidatus Limnocylindrales bacterium]
METSDRSVVAVAGGSGFVGRSIVRELAARGNRVIVLSHRPPIATTDRLIEFRQADVTRPDDLPKALAGVDTLVICLAFRNSPIEAPRRGQTFERVDAGGTETLVAAARTAGIRRLVYISGAGAAPDALRHWFRAKWRAEEAVRGSGIVYTIFRPSWIYGPGDHSLNRFLGFARWLPFVPQIGNGKQLLAPVFVNDIGALVGDALVAPAATNATLEVGGPETLTMDEVIREALRILHKRRPIIHAPVVLMKLFTRPLTLLPSPPMTPDAIDFVVQSAPVDTAPLTAMLPRHLTPLAEGLASYLAPRK